MTPMDRGRNPGDWEAILTAVRERAGGRCECTGECGRDHGGRCPQLHGQPSLASGWPMTLTTVHLWRGPCAAHDAAGVKCYELAHLFSMCIACHLAYDRPKHDARRRANRLGRISREDLS